MPRQTFFLVAAVAACLPLHSVNAQEAAPAADAVARQYFAQLSAVASADRPVRSRRQSSAVQIGLGSSALETSSLDTGAGLQSSARGRMPEEEWRRLFPAKKQK